VSLITDVVVVCMYPEPAAIEHVNKLLAADRSFEGQQFEPLDMTAAGGYKAISADVYAASFNYGDISSLRQYLTEAPWRRSQSVTICVDGETVEERIFPGCTEAL
jgi:hypothetical protein